MDCLPWFIMLAQPDKSRKGVAVIEHRVGMERGKVVLGRLHAGTHQHTAYGGH
jgi:hypothetical protein